MKSLLSAFVLSAVIVISSCSQKSTESSVTPKQFSLTDSISNEQTKSALRNIQIAEDGGAFSAFIDSAISREGKGQVAKNEVWLSVINYDARTGNANLTHVNGDEKVYPASVIKLAYMLMAYHQVETGELVITDEIYEDLTTMIQVSSNEATANMVEVLTDTDDGESLPEPELAEFIAKRLIISNYLESIGLGGIFAFNKTYSGAVRLYGRERDALGERAGDNFEKSNMMTTNDTAKLLYLIATRQVVSPKACDEMMKLMKRDTDQTFISDIQVPGVINVYSKGGSTGLTRHDAAIYEYANGNLDIVVVFSKTRNVSGERGEVLEEVARQVLN